ncbi:hypothetical protein DFH06DRAFT_1467545 [Mycena polygramma]|nr:hypothetical protein DFH06DRAFT_1467545 [Mycena polygramma]
MAAALLDDIGGLVIAAILSQLSSYGTSSSSIPWYIIVRLIPPARSPPSTPACSPPPSPPPPYCGHRHHTLHSLPSPHAYRPPMLQRAVGRVRLTERPGRVAGNGLHDT